MQGVEFALETGDLRLGIGNLAGAKHVRQLVLLGLDLSLGALDRFLKLGQLLVDKRFPLLLIGAAGRWRLHDELARQLVCHRLPAFRAGVDHGNLEQLGVWDDTRRILR